MRFGLVLEEGTRGIGWTAWAGRRAVGLGGVLIGRNGQAWGHFAATPDYRGQILRGLHRRTLRLLARLTRAGVRDIRAVCDMDIPRAAAWMERLGFAPSQEEANGGIVHVRKA